MKTQCLQTNSDSSSFLHVSYGNTQKIQAVLFPGSEECIIPVGVKTTHI